MHVGAMGVPMDQRVHPVLAHDPLHFRGCHVGDLRRLHAGLRAAFVAQLACQLPALAQRQVTQDEQHQRVAQDAAHAHVGLVGGAQAVAVHQQHAFAFQRDDAGVLEQRAAGLAAERPADQEVAVAMHQEDMRAGLAQLPQGGGDLVLEGRHAVVADPHLEEVAEDVQRIGPHRAFLQKTQKRPGDVRAFLFKMQIGDQQDHSMTSARSMITSSAGTSWWPPRMVVGTPLILLTTSMPSTTSPNTV